MKKQHYYTLFNCAFLISFSIHNTVSTVLSPLLNQLYYKDKCHLLSLLYINLLLNIFSIILHKIEANTIGLNLFLSLYHVYVWE